MIRLSNKRTTVILLILLSASIALRALPRTTSAQTIPTRTPTPPPATATSDDNGSDPDPDPGGDPGQDPAPQPTSTNIPDQPSGTSTSGAPPPTPEGGFLPTAEPCSLEPTLRATANGINVRSGPGLDYEVVGTLLFNEVRPIIGRAAQAPWWQATLADGTIGWVSNSLVEVSGYVGDVPVLDAPALESGATVTPGTPWAPTPRPQCTPPPSTTPTLMAATVATGTPTAAGESGPEEVAPGTLEEEESSPTPTPVTPSATPIASETPQATITLAVPTAEPLPVENSDPGQNIPWMPLLGLGLVLTAAGIFVVQRRRQ